eukprot:205487_1
MSKRRQALINQIKNYRQTRNVIGNDPLSGGLNVAPVIEENSIIRETSIAEDIISENTGQNEHDAGKQEDHKTDNNESLHIPEPELLTTIAQNEQSPFSCVDYETDKQCNYNLSFGDLQQWRVYTLSKNA